MKQDLQRYLDCSWKSTLLKSCDLCEMVWQKELDRLKSASKVSVKTKKQAASNQKKFEGLSNTELEEIAFSIHTPDDMAQMALSQLLKIA